LVSQYDTHTHTHVRAHNPHHHLTVDKMMVLREYQMMRILSMSQAEVVDYLQLKSATRARWSEGNTMLGRAVCFFTSSSDGSGTTCSSFSLSFM